MESFLQDLKHSIRMFLNAPGFTLTAILYDKVHPAKAVNATIISLDEAPQGYKDFDKGAAKKYVLDPHGMISAN